VPDDSLRGYDPLGLGTSPTEPVAPRVRLASPVTGEEEVSAIAAVLASGVLTNGPATKAFERRFASRHQVDHAVAMANGTVALAAMYLALGIGAGDEVIVPSMTFISTATSVLHVGARPVFADVHADTCNLDPSDVARRITGRTRAIMAVHYAGQSADMDELRALADEAGVALLEDAAEAHGASYRGRPVGGLSVAAMFSFTPTKNITTGEGGMVTTDDGDLARALRLLRNHGQSAPYHHTVLGHNWRMTEMQAAMGCCQMDRLDGIIAAKQANAELLRAELAAIPGIAAPVARPDRSHVYMLYTTQVDKGRDQLRDALVAEGIEARVYFPPAHRQPVFADERHDLPVTDELADRVLSLPFHSRLGPDDLGMVVDAVRRSASSSATGRSWRSSANTGWR